MHFWMHNKCMFNKQYTYHYQSHFVIQQDHLNSSTHAKSPIKHLYYYHKFFEKSIFDFNNHRHQSMIKKYFKNGLLCWIPCALLKL